jgi:hypothetical protein
MAGVSTIRYDLEITLDPVRPYANKTIAEWYVPSLDITFNFEHEEAGFGGMWHKGGALLAWRGARPAKKLIEKRTGPDLTQDDADAIAAFVTAMEDVKALREKLTRNLGRMKR